MDMQESINVLATIIKKMIILHSALQLKNLTVHGMHWGSVSKLLML